MDREETINRLNELKSMDLPRLTYEDIKTPNNNYSEEQIILINEYMKSFAKIDNNHKCLMCGSESYSWGLLHGSAYCNNCGWEFRVYHFIKDTNGKEFRLERVLQYHPDCFSVDEE